MFLYHQNFVLQLYLYGRILVCISAQFVLRTTVLKNGWCYGQNDNILVFLGTLASLVLCNKFEGDQFTLLFLLLFFDLQLGICFILTHFSSLSIVFIVFTSSGCIYYSIQRPVNFLFYRFEQIYSCTEKYFGLSQ